MREQGVLIGQAVNCLTLLISLWKFSSRPAILWNVLT